MLPEGKYIGRITEWNMTTSKDKGTPGFYVKFLVTAAVQDGEECDCENVTRSFTRWIADKTFDDAMKELSACGWNGVDFDELIPGNPNSFDFKNVKIKVYCKHGSYEGKEREEWRFDFGGGYQVKQMESSQVKSLNSMFGSRLKMLRNGAKLATADNNANRTATPAQDMEGAF